MKFGVFSVSTPEYDIPETVKLLKECGYDAVEWRVAVPAPPEKPEDYTYERRYWSYNRSTVNIDKVDEEIAQVKNICDEAGLEIASLTTYLKLWETESIERVMKAAALINCKNIRLNVPTYDGKENYRELFTRTVRQVKVLEKMAAGYGVRINFEIHMGNIIPSASAAYRLVSEFDPRCIGIIHDCGNMVREGFEDYRLGLELLGEYLAHVHIKNAVWKLSGTDDKGIEKYEPVWSPLFKGYADLPRLIGLLKEMNYQGYVCLEDFSNEQDTKTKLRENIKILRQLV